MKQRIERNNQKNKVTKQNLVHVQLDIKCSCTNNDAIIQFARRYLKCSYSMPIRFIRLFIGVILPHSPSIKISIYDCNNRLLKDTDRLYSLKRSSSNSILIYFTLFNTVTSLLHCSCLSSSINEQSPIIIQSDIIERVLLTLSCPSPIYYSSELDSSLVELITDKYGEICSTSSQSISQENYPQYPLDLSQRSKIFPIKSISTNSLFFHHRENSH